MDVRKEGAEVEAGTPPAAIAVDGAPKSMFSDLLAELDAPGGPKPGSAGIPELLVCTSALESIGHLQKEIQSMWGSPELDVFISRLFVDSRDGARKGLPREVADELVFLARVNKMLRALETADRLKLSVGEAYLLVDQGDQSRLEAAQRAAAQQANLLFASRHEESTDAPFVELLRYLFTLMRSRYTIYLIVAAAGTWFFWPWIPGWIHSLLK